MYSLYICIESDSGILSCPRTVTLILFCIWFQGRSQDLGGGAKNIYFEIWKAMRFARGVRGHAPPPPRIFFNGAICCAFDVYLDQILTLKNFEKYHFLYIF